MPGWAARRLTDVPVVTGGDDEDPVWHPLQHFFGLTAFGVNAFVAREAKQTSSRSTTSGRVHRRSFTSFSGARLFELDSETVVADTGTAVAIPSPAVTRRAVALEAGTTLLAIGVAPGCFTSTWLASHFDDVPRAAG